MSWLKSYADQFFTGEGSAPPRANPGQPAGPGSGCDSLHETLGCQWRGDAGAEPQVRTRLNISAEQREPQLAARGPPARPALAVRSPRPPGENRERARPSAPRKSMLPSLQREPASSPSHIPRPPRFPPSQVHVARSFSRPSMCSGPFHRPPVMSASCGTPTSSTSRAFSPGAPGHRPSVGGAVRPHALSSFKAL